MSEIINAYAWFRASEYRRAQEPPLSVIRPMLAQIETQLRARHLIPVSLDCTTFADDAARTSCIAVAAEPGEMNRPLTCWFQRQHPRWRWTDSAPLIADPALGAREVNPA